MGNYEGEEVFTPFKALLPMVDPNDFVLGGWDISGLNMAEAMERAKVCMREQESETAAGSTRPRGLGRVSPRTPGPRPDCSDSSACGKQSNRLHAGSLLVAAVDPASQRRPNAAFLLCAAGAGL